MECLEKKSVTVKQLFDYLRTEEYRMLVKSTLVHVQCIHNYTCTVHIIHVHIQLYMYSTYTIVHVQYIYNTCTVHIQLYIYSTYTIIHAQYTYNYTCTVHIQLYMYIYNYTCTVHTQLYMYSTYTIIYTYIHNFHMLMYMYTHVTMETTSCKHLLLCTCSSVSSTTR